MSAKKVWGVIFIILGVIGLLYAGYSYIEISNEIDLANHLHMRMSPELHQFIQKNIDDSYKEISIFFGIGIFLSIIGTKMLK